jgi:hypothetical protein
VLGLAVLGAALAPIYPLLIAETPRRVGARYAEHAIGFQMSAAYVGAVTIPAVLGVVARRHGLLALARSSCTGRPGGGVLRPWAERLPAPSPEARRAELS